MDTKEAIEFKESIKFRLSHWEEVQLNKILSLLQQGEALKTENVELKAYKQIVKVVEDEFGEYALTIHTPTKHFPLRYASKYEDRRNTIKVFIEEIKQKYLREAKQDEANNR